MFQGPFSEDKASLCTGGPFSEDNAALCSGGPFSEDKASSFTGGPFSEDNVALAYTGHAYLVPSFLMRGSVPTLCRRHGGTVINLA
jgi:hypothetical protein